MQRFIISPLFALSRFFINIYGIFLKFFLQLNGGYWSRIGLAENITEERIKKRRLYILPFYILLALLFGLLSALYWYLVILYVPLSIILSQIQMAQIENNTPCVYAIWF